MGNSGIAGLLNISRSSLTANSQGIRVIGNNIANVNTPGYSRRISEFQTVTTTSGQDEQYGQGVVLSRARRALDEFLGRAYRTNLSERDKAVVRDEILARAEAPFSLANDASSIGYNLSAFFSSLDDLAANPADISLRQNVIQKGQLLTQAINSAYNTVADLQREADSRIGTAVSSVNVLTQQLSETNALIRAAQGGPDENPGLLDRRDELIRQLAQKLSITTTENPDGTIQVYLENGFALVTSISARTLDYSRAPTLSPPVVWQNGLDGAGLGHIVWDSDPSAGTTHVDLSDVISAGSGEIAGLFQLRGVQSSADTSPFDAVGDLVDIATRIELVARDLLTRFNTAYLGPVDEDGGATADWDASSVNLNGTAPGVYGLFGATGLSDTGANGLPDDLSVSGRYAANLSFVVSDPANFAAAIDGDPTSGVLLGAPGDNRNILRLTDLRDNVVNYSLGNLATSATLEGFYEDTVAFVGGLKSRASTEAALATDRHDQAKALFSAVSGVSQDEEFANLITLQRAFQGSARMVKLADELLGDIIGLLG